MTFTLPMAALVAVVVAAVSVALYVILVGRERSEVLSRVDGRPGGVAMPTPLLLDPQDSASARLAAWLEARMPAALAAGEGSSTKLVHAGFDGNDAPIIYAAIRLVFGLLFPAAAFVFAPVSSTTTMLAYVGFSAAVGVFGPPAVLDRLILRRRARLRISIPDALDLLVVCVEAGVSLDAAILRVARDMAPTHPDLANEFLGVNRRVNAGIPRDRALHGMWERTGLEELRGLVSSMVQSEKWGTSISKVLRIYAADLRRKRKQSAEKRAAEAGIKMLFPLMLFLLPAIFVVILGPAIMTTMAALASVK